MPIEEDVKITLDDKYHREGILAFAGRLHCEENIKFLVEYQKLMLDIEECQKNINQDKSSLTDNQKILSDSSKSKLKAIDEKWREMYKQYLIPGVKYELNLETGSKAPREFKEAIDNANSLLSFKTHIETIAVSASNTVFLDTLPKYKKSEEYEKAQSKKSNSAKRWSPSSLVSLFSKFKEKFKREKVAEKSERIKFFEKVDLPRHDDEPKSTSDKKEKSIDKPSKYTFR